MPDLALRILLQAQDAASKVVKDVGGSLQDMGNSAARSSSGLAMAAAGATVVAGAILSTIQPAADFQSQLTSLVTGAGELPKNLGMVSDGILKIATDTGTATSDLTSAMFMINSSGKIGADGLKVLSAAAQGAKTDNADLTTVTKALTTIMTDYHLPASQAVAATNELIAAAKAGKMHMQDLASSMGNVLPVATKAGLSFADVGGAIAEMTNAGMTAQRASTNLANAIRSLSAPSGVAQKSMKAVGLTAQELKDTLSTKGLPAALQLIEDHIGKKFPAGSVEATAALKNIMGGATGLNVALMVGGKNMDDYRKNVANISAALKAGGSSVEGWDLVQGNFNTKMQQAQAAVEVLRIKIGTALLPVVTQIVGAIAPVIGAFSNFVDWLSKTNLLMPVLMGILAGCAALILAVVVPALVSMAVSAIAATWPFYLIAAAIAAVVAAFLYFYNNSKPFKAFIDSAVVAVKNFAEVLWGDLKTAMGFIGSFLQSTFLPVWKQLQDVWNNQILPSVKQLIATFNQVKPELTFIAQIVGVELVIAFGVLVGVVSGLVKAFATFIGGMAVAFGGAVQIVSGFIQIISGYVAFIVDLFTGHFDKLGGDLKVILGGIESVFSGFGDVIKGLFQAWIGSVLSYVSGFATGITGYFNQILHGADDKTKATSLAVQTNTAQMRDKSIMNAQFMSEQTQMKFIDMRNGIEAQLKQTTDATQRHTLEMKLVAVNNSLEMAQASGRNIMQMREKSLEQVNLLKQGVDVKMMSAADLAKYHSLNMKDQYLGGVIAMETQSIQKVDDMRLGIIDELSKTTDAAKKHSLEMRLTQVTKTEDTAKQVVKNHVQMRTNVESELDKFRKNTGDKFGSIQKDTQNIVGNTGKWIEDRWSQSIKWIGNTLQSGGKWIGEVWHNAVNTVVGWFNYLYKKSYLFQATVDDIKAIVNGVAAFLKFMWQVIVTNAVATWNTLVTSVKFLGNVIATNIQNTWNTIVTSAKWLWNNIAYPFIHAYDQYIQQPLANFWKQVGSTAETWQKDANQWGFNLISGLANGIKNAAASVLHYELNSVAAGIKAVIGWHSPTKEGPGSDSDKWAPNLVRMMSTGLESGVPQIQNAVNKLAKPIAMTLGVSNSGALNSLGNVNLKSSAPLAGRSSTTNNSSGGQTFIINITVPQGRLDRAGAQQIAQVVKDELSRELRGSGKLTTWTSGGAT